MTSDKQLQANRKNALKSTGPKTPEGKAAVRQNALKHGLLSQDILLPGEDKAAFEELNETLRAELEPVGELENQLVDRIVATFWRLRRLERVEVGIFTWQHYEELAERAEQEARTYEANLFDEMGDLLDNVTDEHKNEEALSKAKEMKAKQDAETATLGRTFIRDAEGANAFSKLSRYETSIERKLFRALYELKSLQAARSAEANVTHL